MAPRQRLLACAAIAASCTLALQLRTVRSDDAAPPQAPPACSSPTNQVVSLTVTNPDGSSQTTANIPWIANATVSLAMQNARAVNPAFSYATSYYCPYGQFVTTVNGLTESGNDYWQLSVNGQVAQNGIDTQLLNPGDTVGFQAITSSSEQARAVGSNQLKLLLRHRESRLDVARTKAGR